jgi:hypothetical protein
VNAEVHVLLGSEVASPGAVRDVGWADVAAACSPGTHVTVHALRDPNEDAAVVAHAADGTWLAAVVDGYGTSVGTHAVVEHLVTCVPDLLSAPVPDVRLAVVDALEALSDVRRRGAHAAGASVSLAVGRGLDLWTWSRGDTAALVVGRTVRGVGGIVPAPASAVSLPPPRHVVREPGERVLLASDGWFDALGAHWHAAALRTPTRDARAAARGHVATALSWTADDAVTVVVVAPPGDAQA